MDEVIQSLQLKAIFEIVLMKKVCRKIKRIVEVVGDVTFQALQNAFQADLL